MSWRGSPLADLLESGRAEEVAVLEVGELVAEQDALPGVAGAAGLRERAERRVIAEEPQDQGVAVGAVGVDRRAAVQAVRMEHDHIARLRRVGDGVPGGRI